LVSTAAKQAIPSGVLLHSPTAGSLQGTLDLQQAASFIYYRLERGHNAWQQLWHCMHSLTAAALHPSTRRLDAPTKHTDAAAAGRLAPAGAQQNEQGRS
jgi:hypothetical protein